MASSTSSSGGILGPNGTTNFVPGLASGMDTEEMVEKLLSGTQAKIDKQNAKKQQIEWKQEIYRDTITKINSFQDKYFSFFGTNNTNLLSSSFYNVMSASSSSGAVKVNSAKSSAASTMVINRVKQLATASRGESSSKVTGAMQGAVKAGAFEAGKTYSFDVSLDGVRKTIKFDGSANQSDVIKNINDGLARVYGDTVHFDNDMNLLITRTIPDPDGTIDPATNQVNNIKVEDKSHRILLYNSADTSDSTIITEGVLGNLGFKNGVSNKLDYNTYLGDVPFATKLQGKNFTFSINGTEIKASSEDTLGDIINRINNSEAEVKVTYSSVTDKFIIESANTGSNIDIKLEQTEGNLLSSMFGIEGSDNIGGATKGLLFTKGNQASGTVDTTALNDYLNSTDKKKQTLSFYLTDPDGTEQKFSVTIPAGDYADTDTYINEINRILTKKFGTVKDAADDTTDVPVVKLEIDSSTGKASLSAVQLNNDGKADTTNPTKGYQVRFAADNSDSTLSGMLGFTKYDENTSLSRFGLSGKIMIEKGTAKRQIDLSGKTINDLMSELTYGTERVATFDPVTGNISIKGGLDQAKIYGVNADGSNAMDALFGSDVLHKETGVLFSYTSGQNAVLEVNGSEIERNTNSFELDGITMELTATTAAGDPPISLTTSKDTDKIVEGLKGFVDDYNALIEELNTQVNAEASYQKYAPLTDAQKKEMSEREIENWEKKAKEGLLRNDSNISKFLMDMRSVMYKTVESAGLALYDIGIESSSNYRDNGKLVLDENKLKSALTTNLDGIEKLFTDKDNGIAVQLQNTLKAAANPSSGSPGSLVRYAGTKDVMVTSNTLYNELKGIKETLSKLNTKYSTERTRYWKQFTQMEQAISKMNSQSSWLTQQFS